MISKNTVKHYCCEDLSLIENYDEAVKDNNQIWHCHHRLEITSDGHIVSTKELKRLNLYFNRPAKELIFLTPFEHLSLHNSVEESKTYKSKLNKGKVLSEETKKRQSEYLWWNNGIEEIKAKECPKGYTSGRLGFSDKFSKIHSERNKRCRWYTNGVKSVFSEECPEGFVLGRTNFNNVGNKGMKWWNNGIVQVMAKTCPEGFHKGKLNSSVNKNVKVFNNGKKQIFSLKCPEGFVEGRLPSAIQKFSENTTGLKFYNNGEISIRAKECPEGFVPGRLPYSEKSKKNHAKPSLNKHWFNNGIKNILAKECPEGFVEGKLQKKHI